MEKISVEYVALGWLFGILSQIVILWNIRSHNKKDVRVLIFSELKDTAFRLTASCHKIQAHLGITDKETLAWRAAMYRKYGDESTNKINNELDEKLKEVTNEQVKLASYILKAEKTMGLSLKKCQLFSTGSMLDNLHLFNAKFQKNLIDIKFLINVLNEEIENGIYFHRLTFDASAMNINGDIIFGNMKSAYEKIMKIEKQIVDKIDAFLASN
jgi:hypothetical protein